MVGDVGDRAGMFVNRVDTPEVAAVLPADDAADLWSPVCCAPKGLSGYRDAAGFQKVALRPSVLG